MELLHEQAEKPNFKLLTAEAPDAKVLCTIWYGFEIKYYIVRQRSRWRLAVGYTQRQKV